MQIGAILVSIIIGTKIVFTVVFTFSGILLCDLNVDHWIYKGDTEKYHYAISYYSASENQPFPFNLILPVIIVVAFGDLVTRLIKHKLTTDFIALGIAVVTGALFAVGILPERAKLTQTTVFEEQKKHVEAMAFIHLFLYPLLFGLVYLVSVSYDTVRRKSKQN